jgi:hypothetical protein
MVFSGFTMKMVVLTEKHGDLATKKKARDLAMGIFDLIVIYDRNLLWMSWLK